MQLKYGGTQQIVKIFCKKQMLSGDDDDVRHI
jgi:hypothetical protein